MMYFRSHSKTYNAMLLLLMLSTFSGCVTVRTVDNPEDKSCNLVTKELKLTTDNALNKSFRNGNISTAISSSGDAKAALILLVAIPAATVVVSGSIAVLGNAVYWLEKQGKCEDSTVKNVLSSFNESVVSAGGMVIESPQLFIDWLLETTSDDSSEI